MGADAALQATARVRDAAPANAPDAQTALKDALTFATAHDAAAQLKPDVPPPSTPAAQQPAAPPLAGAIGVQGTAHIAPADPVAAAASAGTAAAAAVPIEGLAVEIAARAREGKRRFEIRLDPPELGRIDVRLDVARDGQVTSRLVVERAETLDLLRRDAGSLERALQSAGLRTDDSGLQFSLRDQSGGRWAGQDDTPRANASVLIVPDEDVAVREAVRRGYGALRGLGRGVDIKI
jgi:chemotaxis protein MotD